MRLHSSLPNKEGSPRSLPYPGAHPAMYSCVEPLFRILQLGRHHLLFMSKWETQVDTEALLRVLVLGHLGARWRVGRCKQGTFHYTPCHSLDHCLIFVAHSRCARLGSQVKKEEEAQFLYNQGV